MYSSSPESFEETLFILETIRRQVISDSGIVTGDSSDFVATIGQEAMSASAFARSRGLTAIDEIYNFVVTNWKEFLTKNLRPI